MTDVPQTPGPSPGTAADISAVVEIDGLDAVEEVEPEVVEGDHVVEVDVAEEVDAAEEVDPVVVEVDGADTIDEVEPVDAASEVSADADPTVPLRTRNAVDPGDLAVGPPADIPIEPRIRERLVAVRRAQGRRRLKIMAGIVAAILLAALGLGLTRSPFLAVQHVRVTGDVHTPRASVLAVTALNRHPQMIDVRSSRLRHELMTLPWVASARIHRRWPATVEIALVERVPVAQVVGPKGQPAIVDRDGRVLASGPAAGGASPGGAGSTAPGGAGSAQPGGLGPAQPVGALPAVNGVGQVGPPGSFLSQGGEVRAAVALVVATQTVLPPASPYRLQAVEIRHDGMLQAKLTPRVTVLFGSIDDLDGKLLALRTMLEQVPLRGLVTLDVRVPTSPVLTHP